MKKTLKTLVRWRARSIIEARLSLDELQRILVERLGVRTGDSLLVHSSFGNLGTAFSPAQCIDLLMSLVGREGNLAMPFYPASTIAAATDPTVCDIGEATSRSGILTNVFGSMKDVKRSAHPTKSLAVWGRDRDFLIATHHESLTPYDKKSPYFRLLKVNGPKAIGLGIKKCSFVHACEDTIPGYPSGYTADTYVRKCRSADGELHTVVLRVHDPSFKVTYSRDLLVLTRCPTYVEPEYRGRKFYAVEMQACHDHMKELLSSGITRWSFHERMSPLDKIRAKLERV